jgi:hypothetical protein
MIYWIPVRVECYSGVRAEEAPRALFWADRRLEVEEILDRWYQGSLDPAVPAADYFRVRTRQGETYLLRHERAAHAWFLVSRVE